MGWFTRELLRTSILLNLLLALYPAALQWASNADPDADPDPAEWQSIPSAFSLVRLPPAWHLRSPCMACMAAAFPLHGAALHLPSP